MNQYKKDIFFKNFQVPISSQDTSFHDLILIEEYIKSNVGEEINHLDFFPALIKHVLVHEKSFDNNSSEDIEKIFQWLDVITLDRVNIVWNYPKDIDTFKINYLIKYWEYIWYSESDEAVVLFFPEINRMVLLTHYSILYFS